MNHKTELDLFAAAEDQNHIVLLDQKPDKISLQQIIALGELYENPPVFQKRNEVGKWFMETEWFKRVDAEERNIYEDDKSIDRQVLFSDRGILWIKNMEPTYIVTQSFDEYSTMWKKREHYDSRRGHGFHTSTLINYHPFQLEWIYYHKDYWCFIKTIDKQPRFIAVTFQGSKLCYKKIQPLSSIQQKKTAPKVNTQSIKVDNGNISVASTPPVEIQGASFIVFNGDKQCIYYKDQKLYLLSFDLKDPRKNVLTVMDEFASDQKVTNISLLDSTLLVSVADSEENQWRSIARALWFNWAKKKCTTYFYNIATKQKSSSACPNSSFIETKIFDSETGLPLVYNTATNSLVSIHPTDKDEHDKAILNIASPVKAISHQLGLSLSWRSNTSIAEYTEQIERHLDWLQLVYNKCFDENTSVDFVLKQFLLFCRKTQSMQLEIIKLKTMIVWEEYRKWFESYVVIIEKSFSKLKTDFFNHIRNIYFLNNQKSDIMLGLSEHLLSSSEFIQGMIKELVDYIKNKPIVY